MDGYTLKDNKDIYLLFYRLWMSGTQSIQEEWTGGRSLTPSEVLCLLMNWRTMPASWPSGLCKLFWLAQIRLSLGRFVLCSLFHIYSVVESYGNILYTWITVLAVLFNVYKVNIPQVIDYFWISSGMCLVSMCGTLQSTWSWVLSSSGQWSLPTRSTLIWTMHGVSCGASLIFVWSCRMGSTLSWKIQTR